MSLVLEILEAQGLREIVDAQGGDDGLQSIVLPPCREGLQRR